VAEPPTLIHEQSLRSLLLVARANENELSTATGFVVLHGGRHYLVTNWHAAAGRNPLDGAPMSLTGAVPDDLAVVHNVAGQLGQWAPKFEPLYDDSGDPLWLEHPAHGRKVDVVALPLTQTNGVDLYAYELGDPAQLILLRPAGGVSIIGFPFGMTGGGAIGIWVQGTIATEPAMSFRIFRRSSSTVGPAAGSPGRL
jgi:hypothetical protein